MPLGMVRLCRAPGVSKAGFYAWKRRPPRARAVEDTRLKVPVHEAHAKGPKGRRKYGSPRVHRALKRQGIEVGRNRVIRLMREQGLVGRAKRRFKHTTDSEHGKPVAENLLQRDF